MSKNFMIDFDPFDFTKLLELNMEAENGEWGENERIELMARYQRYRGIVEEQAYVIRGSVLTCQYGTKEVRIDCTEDHGVYVGRGKRKFQRWFRKTQGMLYGAKR